LKKWFDGIRHSPVIKAKVLFLGASQNVASLYLTSSSSSEGGEKLDIVAPLLRRGAARSEAKKHFLIVLRQFEMRPIF
jgi:hypothetical protein